MIPGLRLLCRVAYCFIVQPEDYAQFREGMLAAVKATQATILLETK